MIHFGFQEKFALDTGQSPPKTKHLYLAPKSVLFLLFGLFLLLLTMLLSDPPLILQTELLLFLKSNNALFNVWWIFWWNWKSPNGLLKTSFFFSSSADNCLPSTDISSSSSAFSCQCTMLDWMFNGHSDRPDNCQMDCSLPHETECQGFGYILVSPGNWTWRRPVCLVWNILKKTKRINLKRDAGNCWWKICEPCL